MRDLRASLHAPHSDAGVHRRPSQEEVDDTTPWDLVDPINASATVRDLPAATCRPYRRRAQLAILASVVLALACYFTTAI